MNADPYVVNIAINTEGAAATDDQRAQALDAAVRMANSGNLRAVEVLAYAAKFADFLAGKGVQP